jgi:starch-binding outer membrane protein, SusD/RagB family
MRLRKIYLLLFLLSLSLGSCELLEPEWDNHSTIDRVIGDPAFAEGLLLSAYTRMPTHSFSFNDAGTDDAVSSAQWNQYRRIATGEWSSMYNPLSQWDNSNTAILYINNFLEIVDTVTWKWTSEATNKLYARRLTGEAYALRALFQYYLLQSVGGVGSNGELLGIPIYDKFLRGDDNFNIPRAGFTESVNKIYADIEKALEYLVIDDYVNIHDPGLLHPVFQGSDLGHYNEVFGKDATQRISGRIAKGLKARVAILAASPAFSDGSAALWEKAANFAAETIHDVSLAPQGHRFYQPDQVEAINLAQGIDVQEMV